jgi:hypothetical protein
MSSDQPAKSRIESQERSSSTDAVRHVPRSAQGKSWKEAEGLPETTAPLEELPAGVEFGENFPEPICYDPQRKVLVYRGQMFHANFTFLSTMSKDARYYHALELLFVNSSKPASPKRWWLW